MTTVLDRPKVREAPPVVEPPVETPAKAPRPEAEIPPPEKKVAAPKSSGRWIRWMVALVVLGAATALMVFAVLDEETTSVSGTSHPLAEVYVGDVVAGTSHPLAEVYVAAGTSHPLAEVYIAETDR